MTHSANLALIRQRLKEPGPQTPTDLQLLNILLEHVADHCAQLQNSRNHWSIGSYSLQVSQGVEDYLIAAADFGRPFLVYSTDPTDPYHVRREVPFSLLQDAEQRYQGPQQTQSASPWNAVEISFFRQGPSAPAWYARPTPIPGASATYVVMYEADYAFGSLGDSPGLSPFHHLIRVQTALSAICLCEWADITILKNPQAWKLQADALKETFLHDEEIYQKRFDQYKANSSRDGVNQKRGVGYWYEQDYGYGDGYIVNGYGW